jgi:hypothetical protein
MPAPKKPAQPQPEPVRMVGTGKGDYPDGTIVEIPPHRVEAVTKSGWALPLPTDDEPPPLPGEEVFTQQYDAHGRIRLDRPLTPREAEQVDAHHRRGYVRNRVNRFRRDKPEPGTPVQDG